MNRLVKVIWKPPAQLRWVTLNLDKTICFCRCACMCWSSFFSLVFQVITAYWTNQYWAKTQKLLRDKFVINSVEVWHWSSFCGLIDSAVLSYNHVCPNIIMLRKEKHHAKYLRSGDQSGTARIFPIVTEGGESSLINEHIRSQTCMAHYRHLCRIILRLV